MYLQKKIYMHVRNSWYYNLLIINGIINLSYFFILCMCFVLQCWHPRWDTSSTKSFFYMLVKVLGNLFLILQFTSFNRQIGHIDTCNVWACIICNLHLFIWATPASQATIIKPVLQVCVGHFFSTDKVHPNS